MRHDTTISYQDKKISVKMANKVFARDFELTEFLKTVREFNNHTIKQVHLFTDWESTDCEAFENGTKKIPQEYLKAFAKAYKLPAKIKYLGIVETEELRKMLSARLQELRIKKDIPQMLVALDLGIARSTYTCYETGKNEPDLRTLIKIADYFDVSLDYLVGRDK